MSTLKIITCLVFLISPFLWVNYSSNNSCSNYISYLFIHFSKDCYYNPDFYKDVPEITKRHVGFSETHQVETEDGYILTLFRIPQNNSKGVVLLQHPIVHDSRIWVAQANESIAFAFWRSGYDVWLGNHRGTRYSKKHINLTNEDPQFWDYSFDEMGYYDHQATIDYIKMETKKPKIIYLGYSLGGITGLIFASARPKEAKDSIKVAVIMAPVTYGKYLTSFLKDCEFLLNAMEYFGLTTFRYDSWYLASFRTFHTFFPCKKYLVYICSLMYGWSPEEFDPNYVSLAAMQSGSEISLKVLRQGYQWFDSGGNFKKYDYGREKNLELYGLDKPPAYNVEDIEVPVVLVYSTMDSLSHPKDNEILYEALSENVRRRIVVDGINHIDFVFGKHRMEKIYNNIFDILENN